MGTEHQGEGALGPTGEGPGPRSRQLPTEFTARKHLESNNSTWR